MTELLLTTDMIVTPGDKVITRRVESVRARAAYARREVLRLQRAREAFGGRG